MRSPARFWLFPEASGLAICVLVTFASRFPARAEDEKALGLDAPKVASLVDDVVNKLEEREGSAFWLSASRLQALGKHALPALRSQLKKAGERGQLACAKAIIALEKAGASKEEEEDSEGSEATAEALAALERLCQAAQSKEVRVSAMALLAVHGDPDEVLPLLQQIFDQTVDPQIVIPLARDLWELDHVAAARDRLVELLGSRTPEVKREAALTLAEIDYFDGEVREIIRTLKDEPSPQGRRAAALDLVMQLSRQLDRRVDKGEILLEGVDPTKLLKVKEERIRELEEKLKRAGGRQALSLERPEPDALLDEIIADIQKSYVDEDKTERKRLILNAIKGMVRSLDDFSSFMDVQETKNFQQSISGGYTGIGAHVNKLPNSPLEIVKPIYGGPAYQAGLLSGDKVLEIEGLPTDRLEVNQILEKLKGSSDSDESKLTLRVLRRGWDEPKDFVVQRRRVDVPSVYSEMLPGKIGYIQVQQFGDKTPDEFIAAADSLEKDGIVGFILDLRDDPGGYLEAAVRIADQFVKGDEKTLPIVTQKGRKKGEKELEIATYPDPAARANYPMVVIVNERSASASEIVAGALQDFGRATLVGKRTFGKGSVQRLIPLSSGANKFLGGEGRLRLTVQYYFLPLGRCVHTIRDDDGRVLEQGGVEPDITAEQLRVPAWRIEEMERIRSHEVVLDYIQKHFENIKDLFDQGDGNDPSRYPGFEDLYKALDTPAPREDLRRVLRFHSRRRIEDIRGKEFGCDFQEDLQLQAAILELLKKLGENPKDFPRYAAFTK